MSMTLTSSLQDVQLRDVGFAVVSIASVAGIFVGQVVTLAVLDTTGLDTVIPGLAIYTVIPALLLTIVPALIALKLYGQQRALKYSVGIFAATLTASLLTFNLLLMG